MAKLTKSTKSMFIIVIVCTLVGVSPVAPSQAAADDSRFNGKVIFIRHAPAPGYGDPIDFDIDDCRRQRNLDAAGRAHARAMGRRIADAGLEFAAVYSSEWCRCLETARLLGLGAVIRFSGLNSFFEDHASRDATMAKLNAKLDSLPHNGKPIIMVTHFVNILSVTNLNVSSGGMVLYDVATGNARALTLAAFNSNNLSDND